MAYAPPLPQRRDGVLLKEKNPQEVLKIKSVIKEKPLLKKVIPEDIFSSNVALKCASFCIDSLRLPKNGNGCKRGWMSLSLNNIVIRRNDSVSRSNHIITHINDILASRNEIITRREQRTKSYRAFGGFGQAR